MHKFMRLPNGIILDSDSSGGTNRAIKNPHFRWLKNVIRSARIVIRKGIRLKLHPRLCRQGIPDVQRSIEALGMPSSLLLLMRVTDPALFPHAALRENQTRDAFSGDGKKTTRGRLPSSHCSL
jgi:hypothetical protein